MKGGDPKNTHAKEDDNEIKSIFSNFKVVLYEFCDVCQVVNSTRNQSSERGGTPLSQHRLLEIA